MMPDVKDMTDVGLNSKINIEVEMLIADLDECNARLSKRLEKQKMIIVSLKGIRSEL